LSLHEHSEQRDGGKPEPRDGVAAATVHLPPGEWRTVFDCLVEHFASIARSDWSSRFERGLVTDANGTALALDAPYRVGLRVHYYREIVDEPAIPFAVTLVHRDRDLVVVDKPHFLPVSPVGRYVRETVLTRLQQQLGNAALVPLHRIDRTTAGLVMFSARPETRNAYQALFRDHRIDKRYEAIAPALARSDFPLVRRSRLVRGEPFIRTQEVDGVANAETHIDIAERGRALWRYTLRPITGKKHQLRVHLCALGAPIVNDDLYPTMATLAHDDFTRPLQLLAQSVEFNDPLTGATRRFTSQQRLLTLADAERLLG
jgi:tRNA pseudouridine32 synthase / 23S rRNA pseudouridine746 synthase